MAATVLLPLPTQSGPTNDDFARPRGVLQCALRELLKRLASFGLVLVFGSAHTVVVLDQLVGQGLVDGLKGAPDVGFSALPVLSR